MKIIKATHIGLLSILMLAFASPSSNKQEYQNNIISAAHPLASKAGAMMYEQGGNAFDAAVAAGFTLAVVEPSMSGIGGRLQALYRDDKGVIAGIDASTEVPINYKKTKEKFSYGYETIGIPGVVAGLIKLHEEKGSLPLKQILAPAINYANNGFHILPGEAKRQAAAQDKLSEFEGSKYHFLNSDGMATTAGDLLVQKDLGAVLEKIAAHGKKGFYEGEVAQKIVDDLQANGGILTLEDLKNYKTRSSKVLTGNYQGHTIHALYLPSFGAITIQILQILDHLDQAKTEEEWANNLGQATRISYQYRSGQIQKDTLDLILSTEKAKEHAQDIKSNQKYKIAENLNNLPKAWVAAMGHTTHLTAADKDGNIVSLTQTVGPNMGSKVATKGLGFIYAVTLGGYLGDYKPGDRANSHITPTFISKNGVPILALGAAGGSRIVTAVTQVISRYIGQKHTLEKSLMLPRVYPFRDSLWIENHKGLEDLNASFDPEQYPVKYIDDEARFGRVHAIAFDAENNLWIGAADPDWEGTVENVTNE